MVGRKLTRVVIEPGSPGRVRYSILLTAEDCPKDTRESEERQDLFLHWIADNQELLRCGTARWEKLSIKHDGKCWSLAAEAEVEEYTEDGEEREQTPRRVST